MTKLSNGIAVTNDCNININFVTVTVTYFDNSTNTYYSISDIIIRNYGYQYDAIVWIEMHICAKCWYNIHPKCITCENYIFLSFLFFFFTSYCIFASCFKIVSRKLNYVSNKELIKLGLVIPKIILSASNRIPRLRLRLRHRPRLRLKLRNSFIQPLNYKMIKKEIKKGGNSKKGS